MKRKFTQGEIQTGSLAIEHGRPSCGLILTGIKYITIIAHIWTDSAKLFLCVCCWKQFTPVCASAISHLINERLKSSSRINIKQLSCHLFSFSQHLHTTDLTICFGVLLLADMNANKRHHMFSVRFCGFVFSPFKPFSKVKWSRW